MNVKSKGMERLREYLGAKIPRGRTGGERWAHMFKWQICKPKEDS